jgi:hypothetical protein
MMILVAGPYRNELGYQNALFMRMGTGEQAGTFSECEWVDAER